MSDNGWTSIPVRDKQAARLDTLRTKKRGEHDGKIPSRASLVGEAIADYLKKNGVNPE